MWTNTTTSRLLDLADSTTPDVAPLQFDEPRMEVVRMDPGALGADPDSELAVVEELWELDTAEVA